MNTEELNKFILRVLSICNGSEEGLFWRTDGEYAPIKFFATCNDFFYWASADLEEITPENIDSLEQSIKDCADTDKHNSFYGYLLFCARIRKMRPQGAYYEYLPSELWSLFDACGPERTPDSANPKARPKD